MGSSHLEGCAANTCADEHFDVEPSSMERVDPKANRGSNEEGREKKAGRETTIRGFNASSHR